MPPEFTFSAYQPVATGRYIDEKGTFDQFLDDLQNPAKGWNENQ